MRFVNYKVEDGETRLGGLLGDQIVDIQRAYQNHCQTEQRSTDYSDNLKSLSAMLASQPGVMEAAASAFHFATAETAKDQHIQDILVELERAVLFAPLQNPGKVICVGGNFPAVGKMTAPEYPVVFLKPACTITGPGKPVLLSKITTSVSYEVELTVVIGRRARNIPEREASSCIAGYTIANDLGDRLLEKRTSQWASGKMFDSFTPIGPALVSPDEIPDPQNLTMETWVNDQRVQQGNTGEMFFGVNFLVSYLSSLTTLEPGDVILTGSPKLMAGIAAPSLALKPGDTVRVVIESLGELVNPVREE
jgi:acylpyruvate hydrolase